MELKINLATASLKDAEHAIFLIAAYHGITELPDGFRLGMLGQAVRESLPSAPAPTASPALRPEQFPTTNLAADAAAVFGASPAQDPAAVFGAVGNAPSPAPVAPQGMPAMPTPPLATAAPSAPTAAAPVGSPVPPAPAPVASALPGVELDTDGLPWDNRINAAGEGGAKPKNADGRWRKKRGLNDEAYIKTVQAELRATLAAPAPSTLPQPPAASGLPVPLVPQVPTPPAASPAPAAPQVAAADPTTFEQLMPRVTNAVQNGVVGKDALLQACTAYQLPNILALTQRPDMVPYVWQYLKQCYPALA